MKKIFAVLCLCCIYSSSAFADKLYDEVNSEAETIYNNCNKQIPQTTESDVLAGNISDAACERQFRECLKNKIFEIAKTVLLADELDNFQNSVNNLEKANFDTYKYLYFCQDGTIDYWCTDRPYDDASLAKLMLEHNLTSQTYTLLKNILIAKKGGFDS